MSGTKSTRLPGKKTKHKRRKKELKAREDPAKTKKRTDSERRHRKEKKKEGRQQRHGWPSLAYEFPGSKPVTESELPAWPMPTQLPRREKSDGCATNGRPNFPQPKKGAPRKTPVRVPQSMNKTLGTKKGSLCLQKPVRVFWYQEGSERHLAARRLAHATRRTSVSGLFLGGFRNSELRRFLEPTASGGGGGVVTVVNLGLHRRIKSAFQRYSNTKPRADCKVVQGNRGAIKQLLMVETLYALFDPFATQ